MVLFIAPPRGDILKQFMKSNLHFWEIGADQNKGIYYRSLGIYISTTHDTRDPRAQNFINHRY